MKLSERGFNFAKKIIDLYKSEEASASQTENKKNAEEIKEKEVDPSRIHGGTDYKKFEEMAKTIDLEDMKKDPKTNDVLKMGCNNDLRKERQLMDKPAKDKQEAAQIFKIEGDDFLKQQNFENAVNSYEKGLLQLFYTFSNDPEEDKKTDEIKIGINMNLTMAKMKLNKFEEALGYIQEVLRLDKKNLKCIYRQAYCYFKMDKLEDAKKHADLGLSYSPNSPEFIELKNDIVKREKHIEDESKKLFKKFLK